MAAKIQQVEWEYVCDSVFDDGKNALVSAKATFRTYRLKVVGGWLVLVWYGAGSSPTFVPDPEHKWDI